jgi:hypothetical protein
MSFSATDVMHLSTVILAKSNTKRRRLNKIISLLVQRKKKLSMKNMYFGSYLDVIKKNFNPYCMKKKYDTSFNEKLCVIGNWKVRVFFACVVHLLFHV